MPAPRPAPAASGTRVLGLVVDAGAGTLPRLQLRGRSLVVHAVEALRTVPGLDVAVVTAGACRVPVLHPDEPWRPHVRAGLLLHDARCPLLPGAAVRACLERQAEAGPGAAVVGVRPVTDTIKEVVDGAVVGTVDRDALAALASPVVVGPGLLDPLARACPRAGDLDDLPGLVRVLGGLGTVVPVQVPSTGRRVSDRTDLDLLECLHELELRLRER